MVGSVNAQFLEPAAEGVRVQSKDAGRATRAVDHPARLFEGGADVLAVGLLQRGQTRG